MKINGRDWPDDTPRYVVQRITKALTPYGPIHLSTDGYTTLCGRETDERWMIWHNNGAHPATCRKCKS